MSLFGKGSIKQSKTLKRALTRVKGLSPKEEKIVLERAKPFIRMPSGLSKKEWRQKISRAFEKGRKDQIEIAEARRLRQLGK